MLWALVKKNVTNLQILVIATFLIRASIFQWYIAPHEYYRGSDSSDYHFAAISLAYRGNMCYPKSTRPIFWRLPGYPLFLYPFYLADKGYIRTSAFKESSRAQQGALWLQIALCSFIPALLFLLALFLTGLATLAWILAWISCFHVGFILSSTILMTDALASLFFYIFLLFLFRTHRFIKTDPKKGAGRNKALALSALFLGMYTWIRPMGEKVGILISILFLFSYGSWRTRTKKAALFALLFFGSLSPWYVRNYLHTGEIFFWPSSIHLNLFSAPKIIRRVKNIDLQTAWKATTQASAKIAMVRELKAKATGRRPPPDHFAHVEVAWPWIKQYPGYALYDYLVQVLNTAFDLHSYLLVRFENNTFNYDPLETYISETIPEALYTKALPITFRLIIWLEFLFMLLLWIGLFAGCWQFIIQPCWSWYRLRRPLSYITLVWLKIGPLVGAVLVMGGFFGYARLRLPIEPLMILLSLTFWYTFLSKKIVNRPKEMT